MTHLVGPNCEPTRGDRPRGFSLIEVVVVLAITVVVFGIMGSRLVVASASSKAGAAGEYIRDQLVAAHAKARHAGQVVTVRMDIATDTITLSGPGMGGTTATVALSKAPFHADLTAADCGGLSQFDLSPSDSFPPQVRYAIKAGGTSVTFDLFPVATTPQTEDVEKLGDDSKSVDELKDEGKLDNT